MSASADRADEPRDPATPPSVSGATRADDRAGSQPADHRAAEVPGDSSPPTSAGAAAAALDFGDPLAERSSDDSDSGWGEQSRGGNDSAADLARFLDEKPPHHL
ncbi:hypothetical protein MTQ01_12345 [Streptomyces sp. XM4193]|uniref:hypothetical protein n=1 Tax=Streptomyces sp. XM4193 TaxID=2929782 RepID=UPI001FF8A938|nr:hypothetical protein [Streptomyces sp. XM4193]MCK1796791.1 hypothetical protein [Streptomyces sp. XM4193]